MRYKILLSIASLACAAAFIGTGYAAWAFNGGTTSNGALIPQVLDWEFSSTVATGTVIQVDEDGNITIDGEPAEAVINLDGSDAYNYGDVSITVEVDENGDLVLSEFTTSNQQFALFGSTIYLPTSVEINGEIYPITGISQPLEIDVSDPWLGTGLYNNNVHIPDGYTYICDGAFASITTRTTFYVPSSMESIGSGAFMPANRVTQTIDYQGTQAQWNAIDKASDYENGRGSLTINYN